MLFILSIFQEQSTYSIKLKETINTVIETDIPSIFTIKYENIINLKKVVADDIEVGFGNKIPLWLFGFLY